MEHLVNPFSRWLYEKMQERGLYKSQLAIYLGVSHVTVGHWLTGKYLPEPEHVIALADYFKVDRDVVAELVGHRQPKDTTATMDFHTYLAREFKDRPLLQKALLSVYEACGGQEQGHLSRSSR